MSIDEALSGFDIAEFLNTTHSEAYESARTEISKPPENPGKFIIPDLSEKCLKSLKVTKRRIICADTLIDTYYDKRQDCEQLELDIAAFQEEIKQIRIELKDAADKAGYYEKEVNRLNNVNKELLEKYEHTQNLYEGMQSHCNQMQILFKENETAMESSKIENQLIKTSLRDCEKQIANLQTAKEILLKDICMASGVALGKRKLSSRRKHVLMKYQTQTEIIDSDKSDGETDENNLLSLPQSFKFTLPAENVEKNVTEGIISSKKDNDHDWDNSTELTNTDTGRGSSLASSDKCFNSPDYFLIHSPFNPDIADNRKKQLVNTSTSPILFESNYAHVATSPILFEYENIRITLSPETTNGNKDMALSPPEFEKSDIIKLPETDIGTDILSDTETFDMFCDNTTAVGQLISPIIDESPDEDKDIEVQGATTNSITMPGDNQHDTSQRISMESISERECLELNNSKNIAANSSGDWEIEMILERMRLHHKLITPIPNSPSKPCNSNITSQPSLETSTFSCKDAEKIYKYFEAKFNALNQQYLDSMQGNMPKSGCWKEDETNSIIITRRTDDMGLKSCAENVTASGSDVATVSKVKKKPKKSDINSYQTPEQLTLVRKTYGRDQRHGKRPNIGSTGNVADSTSNKISTSIVKNTPPVIIINEPDQTESLDCSKNENIESTSIHLWMPGVLDPDSPLLSSETELFNDDISTSIPKRHEWLFEESSFEKKYSTKEPYTRSKLKHGELTTIDKPTQKLLPENKGYQIFSSPSIDDDEVPLSSLGNNVETKSDTDKISNDIPKGKKNLLKGSKVENRICAGENAKNTLEQGKLTKVDEVKCNLFTDNKVSIITSASNAKEKSKPVEIDEDSIPLSSMIECSNLSEREEDLFEDRLLEKQNTTQERHGKNTLKHRKLTKLEKMRQKLLPKSKIRSATPPIKKMRHKPLQISPPSKHIAPSDNAASLNDKDVYENAIKVMSELNLIKQTKKNKSQCNSKVTNEAGISTESSNSNKDTHNSTNKTNTLCSNEAVAKEVNSISLTQKNTDQKEKVLSNVYDKCKKELVIAVVKCDIIKNVSLLSSPEKLLANSQNESFEKTKISPNNKAVLDKKNQVQSNHRNEERDVKCEANADQQESRKRPIRLSDDNPDIHCKRTLRSSTLTQSKSHEHDASLISNILSDSENDANVTNTGPLSPNINGMHDVDCSTPNKSSSTQRLLNYEDIDMFTDDKEIPTKQVHEDKVKLYPKDSIFCKILEQTGKQPFKKNRKILPDPAISTKIKEEIALICELPQKDTKNAMNNLVTIIKNWDRKQFLAGFMVYLEDPERKMELFKKIYSPPGPSMTKAEQILLYVISQLRGSWSDVVERILWVIEYKLFNLNATPHFDQIESISHFFALLCRYFKLKSRLRLFMIDALYCMQYKAVPLIKQCLEVWMLILPLAHMGIAKSPMVTTMVYLLHYYKCQDQSNRVQEIKTILNRKYSYKITDWNEPKILEMYKNAINETRGIPLEKKLLRLAVLLIAKRNGPRWCQRNMITGILMTILKSDKVSERAKIFCASILGPLLKPYRDENMRSNCEVVINYLLDMLKHNPSSQMEEAVYTSLISISRHDLAKVVKPLLAWHPQRVSPEMERVLRDFVAEKNIPTWTRLLSEMQLQ
ncbi:uncharacterized protein LOC135087799 [Ostrinia nubilalis]|uniref:uncharacterized protein LOC135087799 n=1 Tax=Ostrinia nubilalis TaxID=29057 RepID=UPI00308253E1